MSRKRRNTSSPECESPPRDYRTTSVSDEHVDEEDSDYGDTDDGDELNEQPFLDASTGQTGAFPGLAAGANELFYGPAHDGIDYLRMVRSEAQAIPPLLRVDIATEDKEQDLQNALVEGGYWDDDGTFTAAPIMSIQNEENTMPETQIRYYESLLAQFALVRATVNCVLPATAIGKLTSSQPISFPAENKNARSVWLQSLKTQDPHPVQISCMDPDSVLELLRLITSKMRGLYQVDDPEKIKRINAWIWAVLGKCQDRGLLGSEEVSDLRRFAQKAYDVREWLQVKGGLGVRLPDDSDDNEGNSDNLSTMSEVEVNNNIESAKRRVLAGLENDPIAANLDHESETENQRDMVSSDERLTPMHEKMVALDMVITVIGEHYGQRDLLSLRTKWV